MSRPAKPPRLVSRDGMWYIVDTANGVRRSTRTDDQSEAERLLREYVMGLGCFTPPDEPLVRDLMEFYKLKKLGDLRERARSMAKSGALNRGFSEEEAERLAEQAAANVADTGNLEFSVKALNRHIGDLRLSLINSDVAKNYRDARRKDGKKRGGKMVKAAVENGTIKRELTALKAAIGAAWRADRKAWFGVAEHFPDFDMPVSENSSRHEWLGHDEVRKLIDNCNEPHLRQYVLLATQTGARKEAILSLNWDNVDFGRNIIDYGLVDHNKRRPIVRMTRILREALWSAWITRPASCSYVIHYRGKPIGDIKKGFRDLVIRCGMDPRRITPHILKHSYISWLCASGQFTLDEIADLADTTVATIKKHYRHVLPDVADRVEQAVEIDLGPIDLGLDVPQPEDAPSRVSGLTRTAIDGSDRMARGARRWDKTGRK